MTKDYVTKYSEFVSEAYGSSNMHADQKALIKELKILHAEQKKLQQLEIDYASASEETRYYARRPMDEQEGVVARQLSRVEAYYMNANIQNYGCWRQ